MDSRVDEMWADEMWADEIERSFGDGPTPPPPATYVAAGRAAVRRRRLAVGVGRSRQPS